MENIEINIYNHEGLVFCDTVEVHLTRGQIDLLKELMHGSRTYKSLKKLYEATTLRYAVVDTKKRLGKSIMYTGAGKISLHDNVIIRTFE